MEKEVRDYDIIILGAGPAGCSCALALKDSHLKVALLDKDNFPRDKICGDAIPGRAIKTLKTISPEFSTAFKTFPKKYYTRRTHIHFNGNILKLDWVGEAYTCARIEFDHFLFSLVKENTSTDIYTGAIPGELSINDNGASVTEKNRQLILNAKMVIGADGANSPVAKQFTNRTLDRDHHVASVRAYYSNVGSIEDSKTEIYLDKKYLPSYLWVFPLPGNRANVGFGMLSREIVKRKVNIKKAFYQFIDETPELSAKFKHAQQLGELEGFGLPLGSRKVRVSGTRFMLVGDAASLIDPISGDGIGNAMLSGKLAADQVIKSFQKSDFTAPFIAQYDELLFNALGKELRFRFMTQQAIAKMPFLINILFWASRNKAIKGMIQKYL